MELENILRQTGEIRPGDHLVVLYENSGEIVEPLTAYIHAALKRNERCIYITGDADSVRVLDLLEKLKTDEGVSGELLVLSAGDTYCREGTFDPDRMVRFLSDHAEAAVAEGFSGLAVTGELSRILEYADGPERIVEYEWKMNERVFDRLPVSALCRYNLKRFPEELLVHIIQVHPVLLWENRIHENPFYIPPEGYRASQISRYQLKTWLESIHRFSAEKSRFRQVLAESEERMRQLHSTMTSGIVRAMLELLSTHDEYTNNHSEEVARLARRFGSRLDLTGEEITRLYYAGLVHDFGKTLVPRDILNKPEPLTREEFGQIRLHPVHAANALEHVDNMEEIARAVRHHHERWDGKGYPDGLKGEEIPLASRILSLVDAYDAMTSQRPYRGALRREYALQEILNCAGTQFDPGLARHFVKMLRENREQWSLAGTAGKGY